MTDPSHHQHCLGTPVSCSLGCVTAGGGGRQRPKAHPPSRLSKAAWGCGGIFRGAGKCPHAPAGSHPRGSRGGGLAVSQSRAERLRPHPGPCLGTAALTATTLTERRHPQGLRVLRVVVTYSFKGRAYLGSSVFHFPSFMTH